MQDPWHSDYYINKPKSERPPKYWFSYRLNKYLEPIALKSVDGLISVSDDYIKTLILRYPTLQEIPSKVITFGAFEKDIAIAQKYPTQNPIVTLNKEKFNVIYVGRGGNDMHQSLSLLFNSFKNGLNVHHHEMSRFHFFLHFRRWVEKPTGGIHLYRIFLVS